MKTVTKQKPFYKNTKKKHKKFSCVTDEHCGKYGIKDCRCETINLI